MGEAGGNARHCSFDSAAEELRDIFLENVRLHLRSDVPVASSLSGGVDSSSVLTGVRALGGPAIDLQAVGFIADDPRISEEYWIDLVAGAVGARVYKVAITPEELAHDLTDLIRMLDEPFGSASIYAQYRVYQMAAERQLKVLLGGQAAGGVLAGNPRLWSYRLAGYVRTGNLWRAAQLLLRAASNQEVSNSNLMRFALVGMTPAWLQSFRKLKAERRCRAAMVGRCMA